DALGRYFEAVRSVTSEKSAFPAPLPRLSELLTGEPAPELVQALGPYLENVRKIGECAARLPSALAVDPYHASFSPQPFAASQQANAYQALRRKVTQCFSALRAAVRAHPDRSAAAQPILDQESRLQLALPGLLRKSVGMIRIRCHGDLKLQNILSAGGN